MNNNIHQIIEKRKRDVEFRTDRTQADFGSPQLTQAPVVYEIPDPTTTGDFCRRYSATQIDALQDAINETRLNVWALQQKSFFDEAVVDMDGDLPSRRKSLAPTDGQCKQGMDISYKERIVEDREFKNLILKYEDVATIEYRPKKCKRPYRLVILRKTITVKKGQKLLFPEIRYFFYLTNDNSRTVAEVVFDANDRCDQENLNAELKSGMNALRMPLDNLYSNWVYLVAGSLAWTLKAWTALILPVDGRKPKEVATRKRLLGMEFRTFLQALVMIPAQVLQSGRRIIVRLLNVNGWTEPFFRLYEALRRPLLE